VTAELYPYRELRGDVELSVREVLLDGKPMPWTVIFDDERLAQLHNPDGDNWNDGRLQLRLKGPAAELQARGAELADVRAFAVLNCRPSNRRVSVQLSPGEDSATWLGELEIDRPDWYDSATLTGLLVGTIDNVPHRQLGVARTWTIRFDDLPPRDPTGAMRIVWVDFRNPPEDKAFLSDFANQVSFTRIDPKVPTLYLNEGFPNLRSLLEEQPRRPRAQRIMREQVFANVAMGTWIALFMAALAAVEVDEDGRPTEPAEDWQRHVLETLLPFMYPDQAHDEARVDAFAAYKDPSAAAALQERLLFAATENINFPRTMRSALVGLTEVEDRQE
jgi:hypothetical protein